MLCKKMNKFDNFPLYKVTWGSQKNGVDWDFLFPVGFSLTSPLGLHLISTGIINALI